MRFASLLVLLVAALLPTGAQAYPWMIRHHYASCATCHTDPSGAGLITAYGRAQNELLVTMQYRERGEEEELPPRANFLFGAVELPEWLTLGFSFRGGVLARKASAADSLVVPIQMASDLRGHLAYGPFRAGAALGYAVKQALPAALTRKDSHNVVSREHWLGVEAGDQAVLIRAGRLHIPFGLRNVEHNTFVRETTRTDVNDDQQHGVAIAYNGEGFRGELMAITGNLQVEPSRYRESGYSGYLEYSLLPELAVGVSSLMGRARNDVANPNNAFFLRQAHGFFGRWAASKPLVLMAEVDALVARPQSGATALGMTTMVQADYEAVQGLHLIATAETLRQNESTSLGGWLSVAWFLTSHTEVRVDTFLRRLGSGDAATNTFTLLGQLHFLL